MNSPRERIKYLRELLKITQAQLAQACNLSLEYIKDIERTNGKNITPRVALILSERIVKTADNKVLLKNASEPLKENETPINREWLVYGTGAMFGGSVYTFTSETDNKTVTLQSGQNLKFFTMLDDSMEPEINKGNFFAVDTTKTRIKDDHIYYIIVDNKKILRQLQNLEFDRLYIKTFKNSEKLSYIVNKKNVEVIGQFYFTVGFYPRF